MKTRYILFLLAFLSIQISYFSYSQEILVSEIYNNSNVNTEWTELVVVQDHLDIRGYSIRDHNTGGDNWQVHGIFADHTLWSDLREGTIILLWHRWSPSMQQDLNPEDGYIETALVNSSFSGMNAPYFTSPDEMQFISSSMNLNLTHEIVQVRNSSGQHVHALGYMTNQSSDFIDISGPKLAHAASVQNASVAVVPGTDISFYGTGFNTNKTSMNVEGIYQTKGIANISQQYQNHNHFFWRKLREPEWQTYGVDNFQANLTPEGVKLTWNPRNSEDFDYQGYLIVRGPKGSLDQFKPVDGVNYANSTPQPDSEVQVVTMRGGLDWNTYTDDNSNLDCDIEYAYRIFVYRYKPSNNNPFGLNGTDSKPTNGRGISYNEDFYAESQIVVKVSPNAPEIVALNGNDLFCEGTDVEITSNMSSNDNYSYVWYVGGSSQGTKGTIEGITIESRDELTVTLEIRNEYGCLEYSNTITIKAVPYPNIYLQNIENFATYTTDTTLYICGDEEIDISVQGIQGQPEMRWTWYKDGVIFAENTIVETLNQPGVYQVIAINQNLCEDSSAKLTIINKSIDFELIPDPITFNIPGPNQKQLTIKNNTDKLLSFENTDVTITAPYQVTTPFPINVPANGQIDITILFNELNPGTYPGTISFSAECNTIKSAELIGIVEDTDVTYLTSNIYVIDFGNLLVCNNNRDTIITLTINGNKQVEIDEPFYNKTPSSYRVTSPTNFPYSFSGDGNTIDVSINFSNVQSDTYPNTMVLYYTAGGTRRDSLKINLNANVVTPQLEIIDRNFDFEVLSCEDHIDTVITVYNPGPFPDTLYAAANFQVGRIEILESEVVIAAGDTAKIPIRLYVVDNMSFSLQFMPCSSVSKPAFKVNGTKTDAVPEISADFFDFGLINSCIQNDTLEITLNIESKTDGMYLESITGFDNPIFSTDMTENFVLQRGFNEFKIRFLNNQDGIFTGEIKIILQPCDNEFTLTAAARRFTPIEPTISQSTIDFGNYIVGQQELTETLEVTNNDSEDLIIFNIEDIILPFRLISHDITDFPITLTPGETITFTFEFSSDLEDVFSNEINIIFDSPCDFDEKIMLTGSSEIITPSGIITASVPANSTRQPGEYLDIPIFWSSENEFDFANAGVERIEIFMSYDATVLYPSKGYLEFAVMGNTENFVFEEFDFGRLRIAYDIINSEEFNPNYLAIIEGLTLLGNKLNTEINLDSINIVSSTTEIQVETENGFLNVNGICNIESRLLEVNGNFDLQTKTGEDNNLQIDFSIVTDDNSKLSIYDWLGNKVVDLIDGSLIPGTYNLYYPTDNLSSGAYIIILQSGNFTLSEKLLLVK